MIKKLVNIGLLIILLASIMLMSSCLFRNDINIEENEDFKYFVNANGNATICDVTELACRKDILIIPDVINEYKVEAIFNSKFKPNNFHNLTASKIYLPDLRFLSSDRIFTHSNIATIVYNGQPFIFDSSLVYGSLDINLIIRPGTHYETNLSIHEANIIFKNNYVKYHTEEEIQKKAESIKNYPQQQIVSIMDEFRNEEILINQGYFWIDYLEEGEQLVVFPPTPQRDGYIFAGWFTEEECINEINLKNIKKGAYDIICYAKWTKE